MKLILKSILLFFLLLKFSFLFSETIVDSVYSDPVLDGYIMYEPSSQSYSVNNWMYDMGAGDINNQWVEPNTNTKAYFSFFLPDIVEGFYVDSAYVKLYQYQSVGQSIENQFPIWNVPNGDTISCVLNHILYGEELDQGDWEKGDQGNANTLDYNVGVVSDSPSEGYRYIDVTECVQNDYFENRSKNQYRLAFQIDTDYDFLGDFIAFVTSSGHDYPEIMPTLYLIFSNEISSTEDVISDSEVSISNYPNPFNPQTTITYSITEPGNVQLQVFNIKGQLIETLVDEFMDVGNHSVEWNADSQPSGIYLYRINAGTEIKTGRCLLLK